MHKSVMLCIFLLSCLHYIHDRNHHIHAVDEAADARKDRSGGGEDAFLVHADAASDGVDAGEQDGQQINKESPEDNTDAPDAHGKSYEAQDKMHDVGGNLHTLDDQVHACCLSCGHFTFRTLHGIYDYDDKRIQIVDHGDDQQSQ